MLAIGLVAGFLVGRDAVAADLDTATQTSPVTAEPAARQASPRSDDVSDGAGRPTRAIARAGSATGPSDYRFLLTHADGRTPIRWNPCEPIHYKIRLGGLPTSEIRQVQQAFDTVGGALGGVQFVYDGTTDVVPDTIDGSGAAGTDIVFAFAGHGSGPGSSDLLSGWEAGRGGFAAAGTVGLDGVMRQRPTHGSVVLDIDVWNAISRHDRAVLYLHEIGHAVGLDHPRDSRQIMSSGAYDLPPRFQEGDLQGFAKLGRKAGCTPS